MVDGQYKAALTQFNSNVILNLYKFLSFVEHKINRFKDIAIMEIKNIFGLTVPNIIDKISIKGSPKFMILLQLVPYPYNSWLPLSEFKPTILKSQ